MQSQVMGRTVKSFALACEHLSAGDLPRASALCQRILKHDPKHAEAWHMLGIAQAGCGQFTAAAACIVKAIQLGGASAEYCANLGRVLSRLSRYAEAAACFRQALRGEPLSVPLSLELGTSLAAAGQLRDAALALTHATQLDSKNADAWFELGNIRYRLGEFEEAGASYEQAIRLRQNHAESHYNLGVVLLVQRRTTEAGDCFRRAIALKPDYAEAHNNLALVEHAAGNYDSAEREYGCASGPGGSSERAAYNRARLLQDRGELEQACSAYREVLALAPQMGPARLNLGNVLLALGEVRQALIEYRHAVGIDPESADAQFNLSLALLKSGAWEEGWKLHEARLRQPGTVPRDFERPRWDGSALDGRRILIHAEQGFGDTLQFCRFVSLAAERGGQVLVECRPSLQRLLASLEGVREVIAAGDPLPDFDCHAPLLSLPAILGTTLDNLPQDIPYLLADAGSVQSWSERLARGLDPSLLRVGLAWAGNPVHPNDRNRSMPPLHLERLLGLSGIAYFSLQKDAQQHAGSGLPSLAEACGDFADTAAAIMNLDLVVSVDTAVAHLAGALGKPVWTLLPWASEWRWLEDRQDTPWYPEMRLFRQPRCGDWSALVETVRSELQQLSAKSTSARK